MAGLDKAGLGAARQGKDFKTISMWRGSAGLGGAWQGTVWQGKDFDSPYGTARLGRAGLARQGKDF